MRCALPLALVVACAVPEASLDATGSDAFLPDAGGPPPVVTLEAPDAAWSGDRVRVRVEGLPPNGLVSLWLSNGTVGQGMCPRAWAGTCLGFTAGGSGYRVVDTRRANASGVARFPMIVPPRAGQPLQLQAVARQRTHVAVSNVETMDVTRACVRDAYEPNDRPREATPLTAPITGLVGCTEGDMFRVEVPPGAVLETRVTQAPADGDVDMEVMDDRGLVLDVGATVGAEEVTTVWQSDVVTRVLYVRVFAFADPDGSGVPYAISPTIALPTACVDDGDEPDDALDDALAIGPGDWPAVACPTDEDHRVWEAPADVLVAVTATSDRMDGTAWIDLYADGQWVDAGVGAARWPTAGPQSMHAVVTLETDDVLYEGVSYTLGVAHQAIVPCHPDVREQDDTLARATLITPGVVGGATGCVPDDDWFGVALRAGDRLTANLSFDPRDADLDLFLHAPGGRELVASATADATESVEFRAQAAGTYFLHVVPYEDFGPPMIDGAPYELEVLVP